jgi:diacylglycerol kinase family enzyme
MRSKFRVTLTTNDRTIQTHAIMVVLANGSYYGTGASISPEGRPDDGVFEVVAIRAYPFWFLFYMLISVFIRKVGKRQFSKIFKCKEAEISVTPPQEMQVDGEPVGPRKSVSAKILPGCIRIIVP